MNDDQMIVALMKLHEMAVSTSEFPVEHVVQLVEAGLAAYPMVFDREPCTYTLVATHAGRVLLTQMLAQREAEARQEGGA